jgi:ABC-type multidrug transport system fused ATPase/permease subunit
VNLLLRFWDIEAGNIKLEGTDIRELKKSSLRSHIGVVSQDNSLFNLSIEENLKFANPKATKKDIEQALKDAEAGFVFDLKDGIKTVI